jgi:hypothetical protein
MAVHRTDECRLAAMDLIMKKIFALLVICFTATLAFGQGTAIRAKDGVGTNTSFYKGSGAANITLIEPAGDSAGLRIGAFEMSADGQTLTFSELGGPSSIFSYDVSADIFQIDEKLIVTEQITINTGQDGEAFYQVGGGTNYFDASTYFASNVYVRALSVSNATPSRIAIFNAAKELTNGIVGSGLSFDGITLTATGGSGDTNAISYMPGLVPAVRTRATSTGQPVLELLHTNGVPWLINTNNGTDNDEFHLQLSSGFKVLSAFGVTQIALRSPGAFIGVYNSSQQWMQVQTGSHVLNDTNTQVVFDFSDKGVPILGDYTIRLDTLADGQFLKRSGTEIVGTDELDLDQLNVTTAFLTNVVLTNISAAFLGTDSNGKVVTTVNGAALTNLTYNLQTNAINTGVLPVGKTTFTNITGNITLGAFSGVDLNYNQWAKLWVTNSDTSPHSVTVAASIDTSTNTFVLAKAFWVTNASAMTISFDISAWGTNAAAVRWTR